jgi:hypothetical protein
MNAGPIPDLPVVPDLVVQIRRSSESWQEVIQKVVEALESGVAAYSVLDPLSNAVFGFYAEERPRISEGIAVSVPGEEDAGPASARPSKEYQSYA